MKRLVGKCGHCGGRVTVPTIWHGINPPVPQCESCHAQVDDTARLPVLPMRPRTYAVEHVQRESRTSDAERSSWFERPTAFDESLLKLPRGRMVLR